MTFRRLAVFLVVLGLVSFMGQQCSNAARCDAPWIEWVADAARWTGFFIVAGVFAFLLVIALVINGFESQVRLALFMFLVVCNAILWRSLILSLALHRSAFNIWEGFAFWAACGVVSVWCGYVFYCTWGAPMLRRDPC